MKINIDEFKNVLGRMVIGDMIKELPIQIKSKTISIMTMDETKKCVIMADLMASDLNDSDSVSFSFSKLEDSLAILKHFKGTVELELSGQFLVIKDEEKTLKTEIIRTTLFDSIKSVVSINRKQDNSLVLKINEDIQIFEDFITFESKDFKKVLDKCKIVKSTNFLLSQTGDKMEVYSENKGNSIRINVGLEVSRFRKDQSVWLIEFVSEIIAKNPGIIKMYADGTTSQIIFDVIPDIGSYCNLMFLLGKKQD